MHHPHRPSVVRGLVGSIIIAVLGMAVSAGAVAANEPPDWVLPEDDANVRIPALAPAPLAAPSRSIPTRPPATTPEPDASPSPDANTTDPTSTQAPTPSPTPEPSAAPELVGYDVSYPQCGDEYPDAFAFAIVGVNGGRVFDRNPCFAPGGDDPSQLEWAGPDAELYLNTGNPGPRISRYWPSGQTDPRDCDTDDAPRDDTVDCAYDYGWNAAEFAYGVALDAYIELGWLEADAERLPAEVAIWLDVEPANSWRFQRNLNVAALEGAVAYLESMGVRRIGFYSTPRLWDRITGGTDVFADHPAWHAGARDREDAERRCREERAFTGGELAMVQWVEDDLDRNVRCDDVEATTP